MNLLRIAPPSVRALFAFASLALFTFRLGAQTTTPPTFEVGSIPDQRVWYSDFAKVEFTVTASSLGSDAVLEATFNADDGIVGTRTFDPATGLFTYVPDANDSDAFTVLFSASLGASSTAQSVTITPLRPLPAETSVFGLTPKGALPLDDSRDFMDVNEATATGNFWFNAQNRTSLRDVTITGKTVVFEPGHTDELWNYNDNADIRSLTVHAETLIIRGALHLPQTNVALYATEVRFEDQEGQDAASISTTPMSSSVQPAKYANGRQGHDGGSLALFADAITGAGSTTRFILQGGNGERAGQGSPGRAGADRSVVHRIDNGIYYWKWDDNNTIYAFFDGTFDTSAGSKTWPGNGTAAKAGGKPGTAGDGGAVTSNLDLSAWTDNSPGVEGTRADYQSGGRPGHPYPAYRRYFTSSKQTKLETHYASSGAGASGPASAKPVGSPGTVTTLAGDLRWLDPMALQKILIYIKRAYLSQHFDYVRENLADYVDLIQLAMASDGWADLSVDAKTDITQILDEMRGLLARVDSNLDFFGNPAGWVPMLSFEVNKIAFDNEIPRALRIMYLNYWLGNKAQTLQDKIDAMTKLRSELRDQVDADRATYDDAIAAIPGLEYQARTVQDKINLTKTDIESLKNDLLPKAKNIALLKKTARALGAIAEIFPVGQPYVGVAGSTLSKLTEIDPDAPLADNALILGTNAAGAFANAKANEKASAYGDEAGNADPNAEDQQVTIEQLQTLQQPIMDVLGEAVNQVRNSQSPSPEVEAELQRLLADEPSYKEMVDTIKSLNREKAQFAVELAQTMQTVTRVSFAITRNLLTIDRLNRSIQENALVLNPETTAYLASMNERARERLLKYHYFMARAFEYRMLQPYDGELDLNAVFDKFQELATGGDTPDLTPEQFESLQAVYEDQISSVAFNILNQYNSNRPTLSAPVRLNLSQDVLDRLNAGKPATINLAKEGLFLPSQENVRIVDLKVIDLNVTYTGNKDDIFYGDIVFQHSGISHLQKEGETYLFAHYNEDTLSKIEWSTRFDPYGEGTLDPVQPSASDQSLLKSLLTTTSSSPSTEDLLLYSRPAADTDLYLATDINARNGASFTITSMRIEVTYDFTRASDSIKTLRITTDSDIQPYVQIGTTDRNGRQDGEGEFVRSYDVGTPVTVEAPESVGQYRFVRWDGVGVSDPNSATTTVMMTSSTELTPVYQSIVPRAVTIVGGAGSGTYSDGEQVPIVAAVPEGYKFVRWEGAGVADPNAPSTYLTVSGDSQVQAIFESLKSISTWLGNISTRAQVGTSSDILIPGFVIEGTAPKQVLVRAVGPTLADFGVTGVLDDPTLSVFDSTSTLVASNDNWGSVATSPDLAAAFGTVGAFALGDNSNDAALLLTLEPGAYTAQVSGVGGTKGVSLVEVYDVSGDAGNSRLVNISGRAQVGTGGDILIPGFVVDGSEPKQYLVRAIGPTLGSFGVSGALADPTITVYQGSDVVAQNDNWSDNANAAAIVTTSASIGAFALPDGSADAVALISLEPGAYTIQVAGVGSTTGVALVEVYEVP